MTTIPFYTELPEFVTGDLLSATRLNQMLSNLDAVYGLDQRMSIGQTYGWNSSRSGTNGSFWLGWVAYHGDQLKIYVQEACTVEFDITQKHQLHAVNFTSAGLKTINLPAGYTEYDCYCIRIQNQLPPRYAYMTDSTAAAIGAMPAFTNGATSSAADLNAVLNATDALAEQFNQPIPSTSVWASGPTTPAWLNDQDLYSIVFWMQHRHNRFEFYATATSSGGQGDLDSLAWHVDTTGAGNWQQLWAYDIPRPGSFPPEGQSVYNISIAGAGLTVGNWYRFRFSHSNNGSHGDGTSKLYYYGEQRTDTAGLWTPQERWDAGDVAHGSAGGPPQLDTMSDNLTWLNDNRRHTTNPVQRKSTQERDATPETRTERVFSKRVHRWLAYENDIEGTTPTLFYTTDRLNVFANVTMPVSYTTAYLDLDTTPVKRGMVFYVDNCNYAIQVPDRP